MAVYPDSYTIQAKLDGSDWTDITADVVGAIKGSYGIMGGSPTDRVADVGKFTFYLNNTETNTGGLQGYYSPGAPNCRAGFGIGLVVKFVLVYGTYSFVKFYGRVQTDGIEVEAGRYGRRWVKVTVTDYMNQTAIHELLTPEFEQSKRIDEVATSIVANMTIAPLSTDYQTGTDTFSSVFDTVRAKTRAMTEFSKVALSELGFVYPRYGYGTTEMLVVEGRYSRNDNKSNLTDIDISDGSFLVLENGSYILQESGDKIEYE